MLQVTTSEAASSQLQSRDFVTHDDPAVRPCRAERMTGPDAEPERVAVKRISPEGGILERDMIEQEAYMLEGLQGLRNPAYTVPLYAMHLPDEGHPTDPAYLVMG